ncbi:hypothetical protein [Streptomyces noursei]|uniref:hypothetical protein n=1 Tax=Streptomyces noursei TaxID=1971 RepID=UPI000F55BAB0|nr:hypothetical protein [Streptomyces noursei]UWS71482.1 hypothetical protein N1H47_09645 [Streptomyces noursei]
MDYQDIFSLARERPRMLGLDGSFVTAAAFVGGCDAGNSWRLLDGFSEWLAVELGDGANLSWQALVIRHALPDGPRRSPSGPLDGEDNSMAVETLFRLLEEFWDIRERDGLSVIFARHSDAFGNPGR